MHQLQSIRSYRLVSAGISPFFDQYVDCHQLLLFGFWRVFVYTLEREKFVLVGV